MRREPERAPFAITPIARRRQRHDALDIEVTRMRQLFDQAPGFFAFLRGPEHVFEITNRAYELLIGRVGIIGKTVREALPDVAGQGFFELLDRVFATREPYVGSEASVTLSRAEGGRREERVLDFIYQPIVGSDDRAIGILVQGYDVTDRVRMQTRQRFLARASEALTTAGDSLDESLLRLGGVAVDGFADWCVIDLFDGDAGARRLARARPGFEELARRATLYPPVGDVAPSHPTLGPEAMQPTVVDWDESKIASIARSPGHAAWLREVAARGVLGVPIVARGQRLGVLSFMLSTSARRFDARDLEVAGELARMASTVIDNAMLARERNELYRREQAARERAEAANQAKDEFLAMLGHELRNPLSPILTAVQLLKLRDGGAAREHTIIERQAHHLVRLVDDLLDVSRIARGKVALHKQPTDMRAVIADAVEMASPLFEQKRHRLTLDVASAPLIVDGDAVRLRQVVANLLTNAARYTENGGHVAVTARADGDAIVVRVKDDGVGIAPELLPRIFDLFVQGPRRADRSEGGLGLGLTLARSLVTLHAGQIAATSDGPGRGTELEVRLPRIEGVLPADTTSHEAVDDTATRRASISRQRVLVVDDNVDAALLLAEMLELRGYVTAVAHDGPAALVEARRFRPDIALLDIGLPVMDGYELAGNLREAMGDATPRLIALTGYGQAHDRARSRAAGFDAHLVKPVDADAVIAALHARERAS